MQQEVENFKKVNMISREQFDTLTPEPPVDPNQEVPPGPPRFQQGKRQGTQVGGTELVPVPSGERLGSSWGEGIWMDHWCVVGLSFPGQCSSPS